MVPIASLQDKDLFKGLEPLQLERLAKFCEILDFKDGARVLSVLPKERSNRILLLVKGKVVVAKKFIETATAKDITFKHIESQIFGEISWLLESNPSAEIISSGASRFIAVDGDKLQELCQEDAKFGREFYKQLAILLARRTVNLTDLSKIVTEEKPAVFDF
ncbi:MAG: hypothetical protein H7833_03600 [Magnetococcus sp. DMHC-1]|nr:hypothetical protein [Magnetococcales bacterium]